MQVLIIEDDVLVASSIQNALVARTGITVQHAASLTDGIARLDTAELVLLDLNLGDSRGVETLGRVRERAPHVPLIVISAIDHQDVRVKTLYDGADDYLTKPFAVEELRARVEAVLRRSTRSPAAERTALRWEPPSRRVSWQGHVIDFTPLEYEIFRVLAGSPGVALSRPDILARVIGPNFFGYERVVDVHIGHVRKKLSGLGVEAIQTVRAYGYRWNPDTPVEIADE